MDASAARWTALIALTLAASQAAAEGLTVKPDTVVWPRWQARVGLTTAAAPSAELGTTTPLQSARVFGDYYFTGPGFGAGRVGGGLRATSGLLSGSRLLALSAPTLPSRQGLAFNLNARQAQTTLDANVDSAAPVPYLGVGYTGVSLHGRWGFSADVGLIGQGSGIGLSRGATGAQTLDDLLRDLRLTPVLQLGVSYSF
jgi:hypothetical protein